jgi:hypothetical protein
LESKESWKAKVGAKIATGGSAEVLELKPGASVRVRFLHEVNEGIEFLTHKPEAGRTRACLRLFDRECPHHRDGDYEDEVRVAYSVWVYGIEERRAALVIARPWSLQKLFDADDACGTIRDRDFTFRRHKQIDIVPADKPTKFDCPQGQPFSRKRMLEIIARYFRHKQEVDEP